MEKHEKTELTLHTVKTDVKRMVDEERFEYTGAFLLWLVAFLLLDILLCAFAGYWGVKGAAPCDGCTVTGCPVGEGF